MKSRYKAVVIGASAGGFTATKELLERLPNTYTMPIMMVLHVSPNIEVDFAGAFGSHTALAVVEAEEKVAAVAGHVYVAPPGYHLLCERDGTLSLSTDESVNWARPSIDVLFETAASAYGDGLVGVLLTGANADGAAGMKAIKDHGGMAIVQDPDTAEVATMPLAAIQLTQVDRVLAPAAIGDLLVKLQEVRV